MITKYKLQFKGFTLVEVAVVLMIVGLLLYLILPTSTSMLSNYRRAETVKKLQNIELALNSFVVVNKRLPCPALGTTPTVGTEAGGGAAICTTDQENGVVPYATLGLSINDVQDAWDNLITYRVGYGLTSTNAMDMSTCDPAGTAAATGGPGAVGTINLGTCALTCTGTFSAANCTSPFNFLVFKGLDVRSTTATTVMNYTLATGAAYVLISHGENSYGAINVNGNYRSQSLLATAGTTLEKINRNISATQAAAEGGGTVALKVTSAAPPSFIDARYSDSSDATIYFDDIIVRPLLLSVINKANLGPRSH